MNAWHRQLSGIGRINTNVCNRAASSPPQKVTIRLSKLKPNWIHAESLFATAGLSFTMVEP